MSGNNRTILLKQFTGFVGIASALFCLPAVAMPNSHATNPVSKQLIAQSAGGGTGAGAGVGGTGAGAGVGGTGTGTGTSGTGTGTGTSGTGTGGVRALW